MQKGLIILLCALTSVTGCSALNENIWHSLKARDAVMHPAMESQAPSDKPVSYQDYARERKTLLENNVKK
jgi:hypothetical protein